LGGAIEGGVYLGTRDKGQVKSDKTMFENIGQRIRNVPAKGGILGALVGALLSMRYYNPGDKAIKNAGKTAMFTGAGFLLGEWIEKMIKRK
jgi:hypothetical protein